MAEWLNRFETRRNQLLELGTRLESTRTLMLTRMRRGTLDWRATLDARAAHGESRRGAATFGALQRRIVTELDEFLLRVAGAELPPPTAPRPEPELAKTSGSAADAVESLPRTTAKRAPTGHGSVEPDPTGTARSEATRSTATRPNAKRPTAKRPTAARATATRPTAKRPTAKRAKVGPKPGSTDATTPVLSTNELPIGDYDSLTAKQVLARIRPLDDADRDRVRTYEQAHKARKTVLRALQ